jgi:hypothetical protein
MEIAIGEVFGEVGLNPLCDAVVSLEHQPRVVFAEGSHTIHVPEFALHALVTCSGDNEPEIPDNIDLGYLTLMIIIPPPSIT